MGKRWFPDPIWMDEPCYIIGGGSSLEDFNWHCLKGRNVLGCNAAFYLGVEIVPITIFGDAAFLDKHREGFKSYVDDGGWVITNSSRINQKEIPDWLKCMKKQLKGVGIDALAWNGNTGASAINLALLFGADPIYLLGYDMQISKEGKGNFHNVYNHKPEQKTYNRFIRGMINLKNGMKEFFPGRQVINLEEGMSALNVFPKESLKAHFIKEKVS